MFISNSVEGKTHTNDNKAAKIHAKKANRRHNSAIDRFFIKNRTEPLF